jgi:hypothetical protein
MPSIKDLHPPSGRFQHHLSIAAHNNDQADAQSSLISDAH